MYKSNNICAWFMWEKLENSDEWNQRKIKLRDTTCSWVGRLYCQDVSSAQSNLRFNEIPIKILASYPVDINKTILNIIGRSKRLRIQCWRTKLKDWHCLPLRYYKPTVIKIVWYYQKNKRIDQWNRIGSTEIYSHKYFVYLYTNLWQRGKGDSMEKCFFQNMVLAQLDIHTENLKNLETHLKLFV